MYKLLLLFLPILLSARTVILDTEHLKSNGIKFTIITICKDGLQYTAIAKHSSPTLTYKQDFTKHTLSGTTEPVECPMDFKHKSQLER